MKKSHQVEHKNRYILISYKINVGLYIRALAIGLNQVLDPYRQRLVDVEKEVHVTSTLHVK